MELDSIQEVHREFFNLFLSKATNKTFGGESCPFIPVPKGAGTIDVLVRYYNRGGRTGVTELPEKYPCIIIQDFSPEFDRNRVMVKEWIEGAVNTTTKKVQLVKMPMPLSFRYQVSVYSTVKTDNDAITDYLFKEFGAGSLNQCFLFKKHNTTEDGVVGIPVPYRSSVSMLDRENQKFEWVVDYTLFPYVHLHPAQWGDYIENIEFILETKDVDEDVALENFSLEVTQ